MGVHKAPEASVPQLVAVSICCGVDAVVPGFSLPVAVLEGEDWGLCCGFSAERETFFGATLRPYLSRDRLEDLVSLS